MRIDRAIREQAADGVSAPNQNVVACGEKLRVGRGGIEGGIESGINEAGTVVSSRVGCRKKWGLQAGDQNKRSKKILHAARWRSSMIAEMGQSGITGTLFVA